MVNVRFELTPRTQTPRWLAVAVQVLTVVAALAVAAVALLLVDANPLAVYSRMFIGAFTDPFQTSRVLNRSAPLILAGLAVYIPLRSGLYNIGAEGQFIVGGLATIWVGTTLPGMVGVAPSALSILVASFFVALLVGAVWVFVPAYLYNKYEVNEILTTLMLVFTAERLSAYLISGPLQSGDGGFPRTGMIGFELPTLPGTRANVGILIALAAVGVTWLLVNRTRLGYEIILSGSNEGIAEQTGIDMKRITYVVFLFAAALAGLAGFIEIAGNQSTLTIGWQPGYGWTAIPIALLGRRGSVQTMLAGFLFGIIFVGGSIVETTLGVPSAISQMIEALLILFLISAEMFKSYRMDIVFGTRSLRASLARLTRADRVGGE